MMTDEATSIGEDNGASDHDRLRTIHIVDDHPTLRKKIIGEIRHRLEFDERQVAVKGRQYVWQVIESDDVQSDDIVISDLYPAGYWRKAPEGRLYHPANPGSDDIENIVLGSLDVIQRFLRPLKAQYKTHVFVMTYVPQFFEESGDIANATFIRDTLDKEKFDGILYKVDQTNGPTNYAAAVEQALALIAVDKNAHVS